MSKARTRPLFPASWLNVSCSSPAFTERKPLLRNFSSCKNRTAALNLFSAAVCYCLLNLYNTQHVSSAGDTQRHTCSQDNLVALLDQTCVLCSLNCFTEQILCSVLFCDQQRSYAPLQVHLTPYQTAGCACDDRAVGFETCYHAGSKARHGYRDDCCCIQVSSNGAVCVADRSGCILLLRKSCTSLLQTAYIVDILFCALCDTNHGLNSFQRVIAV